MRQDRNWRDDALCATEAADGIDFFSDNPDDIAMAKAVCAECPVRRQCLSEALNNEDRFGVWGGADEDAIQLALSIDKYGKPSSKERLMVCPLCSSRDVATLVTQRTKRHLQCQNCNLDWWGRVPTQIVKINAEAEDENDEDDVESDIPAGNAG
jgi:hypothetical protein